MGPTSKVVDTSSERHRANRQHLKRESDQVLGPLLWGSDLTWDSIGYNAGLYHLLWPLRRRIQVLAHKHRYRPAAFERELRKVFERYLRKVENEPWFQRNVAMYAGFRERVEKCLREPRSQGSPSTLPWNCSERQLAAVAELIPLVRRLFEGRRVKAKPKRLVGILSTLASAGPGRKPSPERIRILALDRQAREHGKALLRPSEMAAKAFPRYAAFSQHYRRKAQDFVVDVRRSSQTSNQ